MVLYDRDSVSISQKLVSSIEEYIDDYYVEENDEKFGKDESLPYLFQRNQREPRGISFIAQKEQMECEDRSIDLRLDSPVRSESEPVESRKTMLSAPLMPKRSLDSLVFNLDETFFKNKE